MKNEMRKDWQGKLLAMDTSSSSMSVALLEDGMVCKEIDTYSERNHSLYLIPSIREAMSELGWSSKELQGIAAGRGPGSYTGVRIGITAAKTMAWALGLPVVGVSTLEAMAAGAYEDWNAGVAAGAGTSGEKRDTVWIVPMMNARRGQVFTALFELKRGQGAVGGEATPLMRPVSDPGWSRLKEDGIRLLEKYADALLERIRETEGPPAAVIFAGETEDFASVIERFRQAAEELGGDGGVRTAAVPHSIHARYIGYLGALRLDAGDTDDAHGLLPNYTQLTEAEVNLINKNKQPKC